MRFERGELSAVTLLAPVCERLFEGKSDLVQLGLLLGKCIGRQSCTTDLYSILLNYMGGFTP